MKFLCKLVRSFRKSNGHCHAILCTACAGVHVCNCHNRQLHACFFMQFIIALGNGNTLDIASCNLAISSCNLVSCQAPTLHAINTHWYGSVRLRKTNPRLYISSSYGLRKCDSIARIKFDLDQIQVDSSTIHFTRASSVS